MAFTRTSYKELAILTDAPTAGGADMIQDNTKRIADALNIDGARDYMIPLESGRNASDGLPIDATGAATDFALTPVDWVTGIGSDLAMNIVGPSTTGSDTKTAIVMYTARLPEGYTAGENITLTINADFDATSPPTSATIDADVVLIADDFSSPANINATGGQTIDATPTDYDFTITGTTLAPGDLIRIMVSGEVDCTGTGEAVFFNINSIRVTP